MVRTEAARRDVLPYDLRGQQDYDQAIMSLLPASLQSLATARRYCQPAVGTLQIVADSINADGYSDGYGFLYVPTITPAKSLPSSHLDRFNAPV